MALDLVHVRISTAVFGSVADGLGMACPAARHAIRASSSACLRDDAPGVWKRVYCRGGSFRPASETTREKTQDGLARAHPFVSSLRAHDCDPVLLRTREPIVQGIDLVLSLDLRASATVATQQFPGEPGMTPEESDGVDRIVQPDLERVG